MAVTNSSSPILLCSDFPLLRDSLQTHFDRDGDFELVACDNDQAEVLALVTSLQPGVVLLDLNIPSDVVCALLHRIHSVSRARILVMTDSLDNGSVIETLQHGAHGVLSRRTTSALLTKSIRTVLSGDYWVSRGVLSELMQLVAVGAATAETKLAKPVAEQSENLRSVAQAATAPPVISAGSGSDGVGLFGLTHRELQIIETLVDGQTNKDIAATLGISQHTVKHHLTNIFDKLGVYNRVELVLYAMNGKLSQPPVAV